MFIRLHLFFLVFFISFRSFGFTYIFKNNTDDYIQMRVKISVPLKEVTMNRSFILAPRKGSYLKLPAISYDAGDEQEFTIEYGTTNDIVEIKTSKTVNCLGSLEMVQVYKDESQWHIAPTISKDKSGWRCYNKKWRIEKYQYKKGKKKGQWYYDLKND